MDYEKLCRHIFDQERVDWELKAYKSRKRELVQAKQICIYLGNWFWPKMKYDDLVSIFNQDRCSANHALKTVKALLFSDKQLRIKMDRYLDFIRDQIKKDDIERNKRLLEDQKYREKLLGVIDSMEIVARVYCDIKGLKMS